MSERITYQQLAERLRGLGYTDTRKTVNGKPVWLFEHERDKKATIFLPPMSPDAPVETMHLTGVRATLKTHGILREQPDRFLFRAPAQSDGKAG